MTPEDCIDDPLGTGLARAIPCGKLQPGEPKHCRLGAVFCLNGSYLPVAQDSLRGKLQRGKHRDLS